MLQVSDLDTPAEGELDCRQAPIRCDRCLFGVDAQEAGDFCPAQFLQAPRSKLRNRPVDIGADVLRDAVSGLDLITEPLLERILDRQRIGV